NINPVTGFIIRDNGIGFNDDNFTSFQTSDSQYKKDKGGKGIGRFLWLKAFERVEIKSIFLNNGTLYKRRFNFELDGDGINNTFFKKADEDNIYTEVHLKNYYREYKDKCPKRLKTIAFRIIEHCLSFFVLDKCPTIKLKDCDDLVNLNKLFKTEVKEYSNSNCFHIKKNEFRITHMRLYSSEGNRHTLYYCANNRVVFDKNIESDIPNLNKKIEDSHGNNFVYLAFLSGDYLDDNVNQERTSFNILNEVGMDLDDTLSIKQINDKALEYIKEYLNDFLEPIKNEKMKRIINFIKVKNPQYRPIIKHKEKKLNNISPDLSDDKLDIELYKISQEFDLEIKQKSKKFLNRDKKDIDKYEKYKYEYLKFIEQVNDVGKSNLAKYIIHRKIILDIFSSNLELQHNEKYKLEEEIHEIIFPMKTTSDDINYEKQNLWIIDEKLSYHNFLASDKPLNKINEIITSDNKGRPDLLIFNKALAFVEDDKPHSSIVVVEFKRPGRKTYNEKENPISQVYNYIREIKRGHEKDYKGRQIMISDNTPCYAYIICDFSETIKTIAENASLMKTPDGMGYFGYNKNLEAYIEMISFDKLVTDARKRNKVLFDKLFSSGIIHKEYMAK
ncbi:MAG: hypothetical protein ACOCP8_09355, partial [archaeon]